MTSTTAGALMEQLCTPQTLHDAWRKVRANKGGPGSDGVTIGQFEANLNGRLTRLAQQLAEDRYYPLPIVRFSVQKSNGDQRQLGILALQDRIVQRAVRDLICPIFEEQFLDCSFGFRPGRSLEMAIARVVEHRAAGNEWVVDADIAAFFDTLDHQLLMRRLRASIPDTGIRRLIQMWLDMGAITQTPPPSPWLVGVERTVNYLGNAVEQATMQLLDRGTGYRLYDAPSMLPPAAPISADADDEDSHAVDAVWSHARGEALANLGRDGLLFLLGCSKGVVKRLSVKHLLIAAPIALAAAAIPTVGGVIRARCLRPRRVGTLQGSPLSPLLANVYLHEFDCAMTDAGLRLVRYADDLLILCASESRARHAFDTAQRSLAKLKLTFHPQKTRIVRLADGVTFLGHVFDADGCYQPIPKPTAQIARTQVRRALLRGSTHAARTGEAVANTTRQVVGRLAARLKRRKETDHGD